MLKTVYRLMSLTITLVLAFGAFAPVLAATTRESARSPHGQQAAMLTGNVYYVSTTGRDTNSGTSAAPFKTFAKAVSVLKPGDTLQVMSGTYTEPLKIGVSGTAAAPITVIGNGAILNMQSAQNTGIRITGSYVTVSNFEVTGALGPGIASPGKYVTIKNNLVHDNVTENGIGICGIDTGWGSALKIGVGGDHITIEGNTVYNNCGEGIAITRGVNVLVKNNKVYDNFAPNIYVDNSPYTTVDNNLVYCTGARLRRDGKRPTAIGLAEEAYDGWGAQMHDVLVSNNTVRDCGKGIGAFDSEVGGTLTNITITRNYIPSGDGRAISVTSDLNQNMLISYNTVFNEIWIDTPTGVTLIGNTIIGSNVPTPTSLVPPTNTSVAPTFAPTATSQAATNTPTPLVLNTPTLASTSAPTNAPTTMPTSTSAGPATDAIFASSFETGNLSEWSGNANGSGDLSVSPSAALVGSNGLQAVINDGTALSVTSDHPTAETRYRVRFYFDPNSISMANGDAHIILRGYGGSSTIVLRVEFGFAAGGYQVRAGLLNDGSTWTETSWVAINDAPHSIELDWRAASGAGTNNGGLTLWVDGAQQADLTGIDNDTRRIERVMLGALASIDTGTRGTYYFDAFESRRQSYVGP